MLEPLEPLELLEVVEVDAIEAESAADAVFIACTQVRALEVVDVLERDLGKPVYTANQCSFWKAFETLGVAPEVDDVGGTLFRSLQNSSAGASARKIA